MSRPDAPPALRPAIFFDRDGTLTRDKGYTHRIDDLEWLPGALEAIALCNRAGVLTIVATNQSGVARGYFTEEDVRAFHAAMQQKLAEFGARIDAFYFCPFHRDAKVASYAHADHPDRKPNPGMIERAIREHGVDPARAFLMGDRDDDIAAAAAAGIEGRLVKPGELLDAVKAALAR